MSFLSVTYGESEVRAAIAEHGWTIEGPLRAKEHANANYWQARARSAELPQILQDVIFYINGTSALNGTVVEVYRPDEPARVLAVSPDGKTRIIQDRGVLDMEHLSTNRVGEPLWRSLDDCYDRNHWLELLISPWGHWPTLVGPVPPRPTRANEVHKVVCGSPQRGPWAYEVFFQAQRYPAGLWWSVPQSRVFRVQDNAVYGMIREERLERPGDITDAKQATLMMIRDQLPAGAGQ